MSPIRARKRFGQHWLRSEKVLQKILTAAAIAPTDRVLEIGPGTGILTESLVATAAAVVAVEVDRDLCQRLGDRFAPAENFYLIEGDFLELDLAATLNQHPSYGQSLPNKVVANIPYYITGPILEKLLGSLAEPNSQPYDTIVLLVQREVAERIYAQPGSRIFGALSVRIQYLAECKLVCPVPAKAFQPPPKVDSAVVQITPRPLGTPAKDPQLLEQLVKQGFSSKRKMLRNNLKGDLDRDHLTSTMSALEISPQARAEDLSVSQWVALANHLASQD